MLFAFATAVLVLPGLVWISCTPASGRDPVERFMDAVGLSIALIALLGELFFVLGVSFSGIVISLTLLVCFVVVLFAALRGKFELRRETIFPGMVLVVVVLGLILWRFFQAQTLVFPAWVDSVHHVLVTQKILDTGGIPVSLGPELPVPLHYHFGFHITAALFTWLSHLPAADAVLWLGQVINAFLALGIYRLTKVFWQSKRAAWIAALLVGLAFQMPAYYLTWGRYTLLTGLLVFLPSAAAAYEIIKRGASKENVARLMILTAGLALTHYMALFFLGLFMASLLGLHLINLFFEWKRKRIVSFKEWWACGLGGLAGIVLALPWLVRMLSALHKQATIQVVLPQDGSQQDSFQYILYLLGPKHNYVLLIAAAVFLIYTWWKKETRPLALWATLMFLLNLPWGLRVGPFRPDHFSIVLFVPAAVLLGGGLVHLAQQIGVWSRGWIGSIILLLAVSGMLVWGMKQTRSVLNPVTILVDQADRDALDWINTHIPQEARFLANTSHWIYETTRGVDGAYWIMPYTGRFSLALPGLYSYAEHDLLTEWRDWTKRALDLNACDETFWALVEEAQLTHLYLHEGKGNLQPSEVQGCQGVVPIYQRDGVWVYELILFLSPPSP